MGLTEGLNLKLANKLYQDMIQNQLPKNLSILPYDYLLRQFEDSLPPQVLVLVPKRKIVRLRAEPLDPLSVEEVLKMVKEKNFFDSMWNDSKGLDHEYELVNQNGEKLVIDHTTALTWQQSGSDNRMRFEETEKHILKLNINSFAGYRDWRLPTLEEAMSLVAPANRAGFLYMDRIFDNLQTRIWTADKFKPSIAWHVDFRSGYCGSNALGNIYVRAVRDSKMYSVS